jgi:bifunctional non-homologous end joining protein LigD
MVRPASSAFDTLRDVDSRQVEITHPERVLFPDDGITKGELADYYLAVAGAMLPLIAGRPVTLQRFPNGIGKAGFYQKQASDHTPDWIDRVTVPKAAGGTVTHLVCRHPEDLAWITNQSCVTPHVWLSRAATVQHPDLVVFDLDPAGDDFPAVLRAARQLRVLLTELELPAFVKTSGSRGLHVVVPVAPDAGTMETEAFAYDVARVLSERDPEHLTTEWLLEDRHGRLLLDTARNKWAQMIAAPYAVRALPGAPVSLPLTWEELEEPGFVPRHHTLRTVPGRLAGTGDPWAGMDAQAVTVQTGRERLAALVPALTPTPPGGAPSRFGRNDRRLRRG